MAAWQGLQQGLTLATREPQATLLDACLAKVFSSMVLCVCVLSTLVAIPKFQSFVSIFLKPGRSAQA